MNYNKAKHIIRKQHHFPVAIELLSNGVLSFVVEFSPARLRVAEGKSGRSPQMSSKIQTKLT